MISMSNPVSLHQSSLELEDLRDLDAPFQLRIASLPEHPSTDHDRALQGWLQKDQHVTSEPLPLPTRLQAKEPVFPAQQGTDTLPKTLEPPKPSSTYADPEEEDGKRLPYKAQDRASRCWEDWYHLREEQNASSSGIPTRSRPQVQRLVTDMDCMNVNKDDEALILMEGLVHA